VLVGSAECGLICAPAVALMEISNHYGFRTWIEYGLKQAKDALGWADFRMTSYEQIEKWWELVMSAFLRVASLILNPANFQMSLE
jgi:SRSO17 transposase